MLYLAIPAYNEVATIGVLLWRLRTVLAEFPREYEVVVYDDASTDETATVAEQYERAMPVTVVRGERHLGYAGAVDALLRYVANHTRYPRRDAVLLLQGDFTDPPGIIPEFARRFEGGADLIVGERRGVADAPTSVRRLFSASSWALRPFVRVRGLRDLTSSMRLVRIAALRDAIRTAGSQALLTGDSWTANADLLLQLIPHARRIEVVPVEPTYGVRLRETRRVAMRDALAVLKWGWQARGRKVDAVVSLDAVDGEGRRGRTTPPPRRRDEPELSVERLREKIRVRDGSGGVDGEPETSRRDRRRERPGRGDRPEGARRDRDRPERERPERERPERTARRDRGAREEKREERQPERQQERQPERRDRPERAPRGERAARGPRPERGRRTDGTPTIQEGEERGVAAEAMLPLDDPFAGPPRPRPGRSDTDALEPETDEDGVEDEGTGDGTPMDLDDPAAGRPKRKRRRVRRGRKRRNGDSGNGDSGDHGSEDGDSGDGGTGEPRGNRQPRDHGEPQAHGEPRGSSGEAGPDPLAFLRFAAEDAPESAGSDDGPDEGADDAIDSALGDDPAAPRRPRGRRGRRGGARRSRGRRDRGGSDGDASGPEGGSGSPPAGDPPPPYGNAAAE